LVRVNEAIATLPDEIRDEIVFIGLSTEAELDPAALRKYAEENGFPFIYAAMPAEFQRALADDIGKSALIPPVMPHFTIARDGTVGELQLGQQSPEEIAKELTDLATGTP
jgi:hypothetical protein